MNDDENIIGENTEENTERTLNRFIHLSDGVSGLKPPWQPGQSGNPSGRPRLPEDVRKAKKLNTIELERTLNRFIHLNDGDFDEALSDPELTKFERFICSIIQKGIEYGDVTRMNLLLDRLVGKVKEQVSLEFTRSIVIERPDGTRTVLSHSPKEEE